LSMILSENRYPLFGITLERGILFQQIVGIGKGPFTFLREN
jgi:hypothetical protein